MNWDGGTIQPIKRGEFEGISATKSNFVFSAHRGGQLLITEHRY